MRAGIFPIPGKRPSFPEQITHRLFHDIAANLGDGSGQRNILWTDLDAILRIATLLDTAITHQGHQTFPLQSSAGGVGVEQRTCAMVAAPTNPVASLNCGQASMQQQQEIQRESGYVTS